MYFSEYYDEDEVYGHSYDDSYCVSPATGTVKHVNVKIAKFGRYFAFE